jgi:hypothetical protein
LITEFDHTLEVRRQTFDEYDPSKFKYYRYVGEFEYGTRGRMRHAITRYEDAQGRLPADAGVTFVASEQFYDEDGRITTEWRTVSSPKDFGGPVLRFDTDWYAGGTKKRQVLQVCDANRQPLAVVSTGNPARREEEFDESGRWVRIYEAGFDEGLVGFSKREAKFSGGSLQSVTRARADGTAVTSVRVIITSVEPRAEQPKAAELKAGDQLTAANGKPLTSTYAWASTEFPGGWVEVLREGKVVRVSGLNPGRLGVTLQERAP